MDIPTVPGSIYTVATKTTCDITDTATGTPIDTVSAGALTFQAQGNFTTLSDPDATYARVNFKNAAAALRMFGGGDQLPSGYLAAEFLESTGTQFIDTGLSGISSDSFVEFRGYVKATEKRAFQVSGWNVISSTKRDGPYLMAPKENTINYTAGRYNVILPVPGRLDVRIRPGEVSINGNDSVLSDFNVQTENGNITFNNTLKLGAYSDGANYKSSWWVGTCESFRAKLGKQAVNFAPAITPNGQPCMFDTVSGEPFYNSGTGQFIVGMTLAQARKLGKLPAGGGTLTVSLPSNWQEDEGVVNALATAEAKGWVFTYQTYEAEAGAASTFALRRIWVRKTQSEHGGYVSADGSRWLVDWCAGMIGADPQEHGYEPFRSVDAAVEYWELEPYVYPEEELLTEE